MSWLELISLKKMIGAGVVFILLSVPALAQVDLSGSWVARQSDDALGNGPGPEPTPVDFLGIPLNQFGQARALLRSPLELSEPEHVCSFYSPVYIMLGPFGLKIWNVTEDYNGTTIAWRIGGWEDLAPMTIWMDGRPHPSKYAPHERSGFTTGIWKDDVLTTYTTHMSAGVIRRNGAPSSDQTTMTMRFFRHNDILTITARIVDPVYLSEPYYLTRIFVLSAVPPLPSVGQPCIQDDEGVEEGSVPHLLPGKNSFVGEMTKLYNIPEDAVLGGAETMYPEYRKKMKDKYTIPQQCPQTLARNGKACGGPGMFPLRAN